MLIPVFIGLAVISITIVIHGLCTLYGLKLLMRNHHRRAVPYNLAAGMKILCISAIYLVTLHYVEIALWATLYYHIPQLSILSTWEESMYFSMVAYSTLGFGDITLPPYWRILSGFEAMNGILLFGWSTAMFFAVVQRIIAQERK